MGNKTLITDFTEGSIPKQLMVFTAPLFLSSLMQTVYNTVDMVVVGQKMGEVGLSAIAVGGDIVNLLTFLAMGFANAGQIIISQYIGAGQRDKLGRFVGTMFSFTVIYALCISVLCLIFRRPLLDILNTPDAAYSGALEYSTVCMAGLVFIYGYNVTSAILRGMGDSKHPFVFISIAAVLNIILDVLFVMGFSMGALGAALATVISQGISFLLCSAFLYRNRKRMDMEVKSGDFLKIDRGMLSQLIKLGAPMAIKSASIQISKLFVNSWINSYGVSVSAFAGVANKFNSVSSLISNSAATAGSSMVGQNIGAEKYRRVPKIMGTITIFTVAVASLLSMLVILFPRQIFGIFTDDAGVLEIAVGYIPIAILVFFGSASRSPMNALINGSGNHKMNFLTAILDGFIMRIGLSLLFGLKLGLEYTGFWLGDALAGFTPLFIGLAFLISGKWKKMRIV